MDKEAATKWDKPLEEILKDLEERDRERSKRRAIPLEEGLARMREKGIVICEVGDDEDEFTKEWYQAFLEGSASIIDDDPNFDYDAFVAHARKVCGYDD